MVEIAAGTLVVGGGHSTPRPYLGAEKFGRAVEGRGVTFLASAYGASGYIARPESVVPWVEVERVLANDPDMQVERLGARHWSAGGRRFDLKGDAVLAERIRIARERFHGGA